MAFNFSVVIHLNGLKRAMTKPYANRGIACPEFSGFYWRDLPINWDDLFRLAEGYLTKKNKKQTDEIR
jgi:hypothetical protein